MLLILAGVALATLTGQGNIIENAENAVGKYNNSVASEQQFLNEIEKYLIEHTNNQTSDTDDDNDEPAVYEISANPDTLDFGSYYVGQLPEEHTVTIKNTGNQDIALIEATSNNYEINMPSDTNISAGESITLTVQPKMDLPVGTYVETIVFYGSNETVTTVSCTFSVRPAPYDPVLP